MDNLNWINLDKNDSVPMYSKDGYQREYLLKVKPEFVHIVGQYFVVMKSWEIATIPPGDQEPFNYPKRYFSAYISLM